MSPRPVSKGHCRYHRCELPRLCSVIARRGCQSADRAAAMKSTNKQQEKPSDARCRGLGALSCSDFVEVNRIVWLKRSSRRVLHGQRVWDAAQQVALYIRKHCLQVLGPLQEHTTFRESLVCYTSPGGVYGSDDSGKAVFLDQLPEVLFVLPCLFFKVFGGTLFHAAAPVPGIPAGAPPRSG